MKRDLTKQEITLTKKGIEKQKEIIKEAKGGLHYNKTYKDYITSLWNWEDFSRPLKRKETKTQFEKADNEANSVLKMAENTLKQLNEQLTNGVEVKKFSAVN